VEYGATAIAVADSLLESEGLTAQVHPTIDRIVDLVAEQDLDRDWSRSSTPIGAWREIFWANHTAITGGDDPPAGLFDRLIAAAGLAADLCGWVQGPGGAAELTGASEPPSTQRTS
jgi:hypothetical protein